MVKLKRFRVLVLGDVNSGKSTLFRSLAQIEPDVKEKPSISMEIYEIIKSFEDEKYLIELHDIPGRELVKTAKSKIYNMADGALVVYDISSPDTFRHTYYWIEELTSYSGRKHVPIVLVGNKSDLREKSDRTLNPIDAKQLIFRLNRTSMRDNVEHSYEEISAKEKKGISRLLDVILRSMIKYERSK